MSGNSHIEVDLQKTAQSGNTAEIRTLLDSGAKVDATDEYGVTALMSASEHGH